VPRIAVVDRDLCRIDKCNRECLRFCPLVKGGKKVIWIDESSRKPVISELLCIGCGICVHKCPFKAITIVNLPEELAKDCVHSYGESRFKLYRLPIVKQGKVLGIIGPNSIGKTTIARILAGEVKPNLCRNAGRASEEEVIRFFRGTELQNYLRDLYEGKLKVTHKIQYIELIPRYVKGSVAEVLNRIGTPDRVREVVSRLNMEDILDRDISLLSGGELQKVAIAAAILKDSSVFIFDEPTTHLDVLERIRVANMIRELAERGKYVVVVEHDLTVLDFIADLVVVLYGKPGAYGIASNPRGAREGVNEYLLGFLTAENVRIRDEAITFRTRPPMREARREKILVEWSELRKKLGGFELTVEAGAIYRGEIVGVVGPNGIGKTTFVRMLTGALDPDSGTVLQHGVVRIGYKPQYVRDVVIEHGRLEVRRYLNHVAGSFEENPIWPDLSSGLGLEYLLDRELEELSGGELQRVVIAGALLKDAEIYVLDEPMAYLDVEQRIRVARVLRRIVEEKDVAALVVEHDIAMVDYLSDAIMPFIGRPAVSGHALPPMDMRTGMNIFLRHLDTTFRREVRTGRPRINKPGSVLDRLQKEVGEYYYYAGE